MEKLQERNSRADPALLFLDSMIFPFHRLRHLLVDLDGVIYRGNAVLPHAVDFISWLHTRCITFRLVTNNATLTPAQYVDKLRRMGIEAGEEEIFTSALATALYLKQQNRNGQTAYVIGEDGLHAALAAVGIHVVEDQPDWVIVGLDRQLSYDKLAAAALAIERGARFLGTNPDTSFPSEQGLVPGAGAIQAALAVTTGVKPVVVGKPEPLMLDLAMKALGGTTEDTAMLGDRLDTDIQGASALGMPSILVLTGVSKRREAERGSIRPGFIVEDLGELMSRWASDPGPKGV